MAGDFGGDNEAANAVAENFRVIRERIAEAARASGRKADDVRLLAVSKTQPLEKILRARAAGQTLFGENYVQEWQQKHAAAPDVSWHFIGSLQRNKVKFLVGKVDVIQSVDRIPLVDAVARAAVEKGVRQKILLQVNIGDETS